MYNNEAIDKREKNGMVKKLLVAALLIIAVIGMSMQGTPVFAETLSPERQIETTEYQPKGQSETAEDQPESPDETAEEGESEEQTETKETEPPDDQNGAIAKLVDERADNTNNTLNDEILEQCIVEGMNPPGVTVNLFDYWQGTAPDGSREVAHDYYYNWTGGDADNKVPIVGADPYVTTYNLGISKNHLLRFGYRGDETYDYCRTTTDNGTHLGDYGVWNEYHATRSKEIVQNKLYNGFPKLNLNLLQVTDFGRYADEANRSAYLTEANMTESLAYLFSPNVQNDYKASYSAVQGLFQQDANGYYYYDSQKNFASFHINTNSFTLYNSPGVANEVDNQVYHQVYSGQFFPFNTAYDVFDSYIENNNGSYQLTYQNVKNQGNSDYDRIMYDGNSYIKCYAPNLNHYLGLTLEMSFVQPAGGRVPSDTDESGDDMIFKFSGDDDVWIFIDGVLVADLGGLHDALELTINFATGDVNVEGVSTYTLYDSFAIDSDLSGVEFNGKTFADNTTHTLKMFYLERGHMASNLSLSFNIQPLRSTSGNNEDNEDNETNENNENKDENSYEIEESTSDSDTDVTVPVEISVNDNTLLDSPKIPKTGDDSLIGWWAALCIISLVGIGATVCNLIIRKRKQDRQS